MASVLLKGWTLFALLGALLIWQRAPRPETSETVCSVAPAGEPTGIVSASAPAAQAPTSAVSENVLSRLASSETADELCELLGGLPASSEAEVTYAVNDVIARARLRSLRHCATEALGRQSTSESTSFLVDLIEDEDEAVSAAALDALATRAGDLARITLVDAAHRDDVALRTRAVLALLRGARPEGFALALGLLPSIDDSSVAAELVAVLGKSHDERALPALLELLRSGDTDVHASAIRGLGELPQREAAPILCSLLKVGSANEFDQAAEALARLAAATLVQELASLLESNNAARRMLAAVGLGRMLPNAEARRMVLGLLDSDEPPLVAVAARFLSRAKEPGIVDKLLYLARSDVPGVRMAAVRALGDTVDEGARAALKSLYDEQSVPLHVVLTNLAVDSSPEAQSALLGHLSEPGEDAIGVIQSFVPSLPDSTRRAIAARVATERDPERYRSFVEALSASADPDLVPLLREALREHSGVARRAATRALISLDVPEAEQLLDGLLNSDDPDEQSLGFESLTERGDAESLTRLAALAGRKLEDESLDAFEASRAFSVLKFRSPERAAQLLDAAFSRGPASTRARMLSLGNGLGQLAIPTCLRALTSDDSGVVEAAIDLAQSLGGERVSRALLGIARDPRRDEAERRSAANALKSIGGPVAREQASLLGSLLEEEEEAFECPWSEP